MNVQEELLREKIDPHLTAANLAAISTRIYGERVHVSGARVLSGGCWNRVIGVEFEEDLSGLVFKISPNREDTKVINEYRVHAFFAEIETMRTPEPYLLDTSEESIPGTVFVMERIPGKVMHSCFGYLSASERDRITGKIAEDLAVLHENQEEGFGSCADSPDARHPTWPEFWLPRFDAVMKDVRESELVDSKLLGRVDSVRATFPIALDIGPTATLTHYDIWSGNVMIDIDSPGGAEISGYIDISGFYADYARELSFSEMFGIADGGFFRRYGQTHPIDPGYRLRACIYNLKMSLKHVTMYPSESYYRRLAEECLAFIEAQG
jgi:fructosamine-3-kinase